MPVNASSWAGTGCAPPLNPPEAGRRGKGTGAGGNARHVKGGRRVLDPLTVDCGSPMAEVGGGGCCMSQPMVVTPEVRVRRVDTPQRMAEPRDSLTLQVEIEVGGAKLSRLEKASRRDAEESAAVEKRRERSKLLFRAMLKGHSTYFSRELSGHDVSRKVWCTCDFGGDVKIDPSCPIAQPGDRGLLARGRRYVDQWSNDVAEPVECSSGVPWSEETHESLLSGVRMDCESKDDVTQLSARRFGWFCAANRRPSVGPAGAVFEPRVMMDRSTEVSGATMYSCIAPLDSAEERHRMDARAAGVPVELRGLLAPKSQSDGPDASKSKAQAGGFDANGELQAAYAAVFGYDGKAFPPRSRSAVVVAVRKKALSELMHDVTKKMLKVKVIKAEGLQMCSGSASYRPAVSVKLCVRFGDIRDAVFRTGIVPAVSKKPEWNEEFLILLKSPDKSVLECTLWDHSSADGKSRFLGKVNLDPWKLASREGQYVEQGFDIRQSKSTNTDEPASGRLQMGLQLQNYSDQPEKESSQANLQTYQHTGNDTTAESGLTKQVQELNEMQSHATEDVHVVVRVRPALGDEVDQKLLEVDDGVVRLYHAKKEKEIPGHIPKVFRFDKVFGAEAATASLLDQTGKFAVDELMQGKNAVIISYGQTGSGKTYTMFGGGEGSNALGLVQYTFALIVNRIKALVEGEEESSASIVYKCRCSMLQVYRDRSYDLFSDCPKRPLVLVRGMAERTVSDAGGAFCATIPPTTLPECSLSAEALTNLMNMGLAHRKTASTAMNDKSSRSHCIFTVEILRSGVLQAGEGGFGGDLRFRKRLGVLTFVDLAGNERGALGDPESLAESKDINMSLMALNRCLHAAASGSQGDQASTGHAESGASGRQFGAGAGAASFRACTLTRLLEAPLKGAKIAFVACCSPVCRSSKANGTNLAAQLAIAKQTLRYANEVKDIKTAAEENALLTEQLLMKGVPIKVVPLSKLRENGEMPRSSHGCHVPLSTCRLRVTRLFVSHRWLRPSLDQAVAHPDAEGNPKYRLLMGAIDKMQQKGWIPQDDNDIVLWIDFACCDQDGNPAAELNDRMAQIIGMSDILLTPIVDDGWEAWTKEQEADEAASRHDAIEAYGASAWKEYTNRGWCRLEMFFASNLPFPAQRAERMGGALRTEMRQRENCRVHMVFGTREMTRGQDPIILPLLADELYRKYLPSKGSLTNNADRIFIEANVEELEKINTRLKQFTLTFSRFDVFISYRWGNFDSELARALYGLLCQKTVGGKRVEVFLDRERLEDGQQLQQSFGEALASSTVAVPLLSTDALRRMLNLAEGSQVDNVLLEWLLMTELLAAGRLHAVFPIFMGTPLEQEGEGGEGGKEKMMENLFKEGFVEKLPDVVVHSVCEQAETVLNSLNIPPSDNLRQRTVRGIVKAIALQLGIPAWDVSFREGGSTLAIRLSEFRTALARISAEKVYQALRGAQARERRASAESGAGGGARLGVAGGQL